VLLSRPLLLLSPPLLLLQHLPPRLLHERCCVRLSVSCRCRWALQWPCWRVFQAWRHLPPMLGMCTSWPSCCLLQLPTLGLHLLLLLLMMMMILWWTQHGMCCASGLAVSLGSSLQQLLLLLLRMGRKR
jgi:hypothetical protein